MVELNVLQGNDLKTKLVTKLLLSIDPSDFCI